MYADVQLEVVLRLEGLPAGGAPEGPPEAVGGQVAAEVTLAGEHLETQGEGVRTHARTHTHAHTHAHTPWDTGGRGSCVWRSSGVAPGRPGWNTWSGTSYI